jgi:hypothetical protein
MPAGWYPTALLVLANSLWVLNGKGRGGNANPDGLQSDQNLDPNSTS